MTRRIGGFKLTSTITFVLQANRLTKWASHPKKLGTSFSESKFRIDGTSFLCLETIEIRRAVNGFCAESRRCQKLLPLHKSKDWINHRPSDFNKGEFFNTLSNILKFHNSIVLAGDSNIDLIDPSKDSLNYLSDLLDAFNLKNLYREPICFMPDKGYLIALFLPTKSRSLKKHKVLKQ